MKMDRDYVFPEQTMAPNFRFGVPTINSENTAKDLIQSGFILQEEPATEAMYKKSHGFSRPAEQVKRDYKWPFDPAQHRFGKGERNELNQVQKCLQPDSSQ